MLPRWSATPLACCGACALIHDRATRRVAPSGRRSRQHSCWIAPTSANLWCARPGLRPHVTLTHRLINWLYALALADADAAMVYLAFRLAAKLQRLRDIRTPPEGNVPADAFGPQILT